MVKGGLFLTNVPIVVLQVLYHVSIVGPRTKLHETLLLVEGEELDVDFTRGLVNCWWIPRYFARVVQNCFGHDGHFIVSISAETRR